MRIQVKLFAMAREEVGSSELSLELPPGSTAQAMLEILCASYPRLKPLHKHLRIAVNREFVKPDWQLSEQDEVAVIPPVSGG